jgi:hypothetical protein
MSVMTKNEKKNSCFFNIFKHNNVPICFHVKKQRSTETSVLPEPAEMKCYVFGAIGQQNYIANA